MIYELLEILVSFSIAQQILLKTLQKRKMMNHKLLIIYLSSKYWKTFQKRKTLQSTYIIQNNGDMVRVIRKYAFEHN